MRMGWRGRLSCREKGLGYSFGLDKRFDEKRVVFGELQNSTQQGFKQVLSHVEVSRYGLQYGIGAKDTNPQQQGFANSHLLEYLPLTLLLLEITDSQITPGRSVRFSNKEARPSSS